MIKSRTSRLEGTVRHLLRWCGQGREFIMEKHGPCSCRDQLPCIQCVMGNVIGEAFKVLEEPQVLPRECVKCGSASGPLSKVGDDDSGWICSACYAELQSGPSHKDTILRSLVMAINECCRRLPKNDLGRQQAEKVIERYGLHLSPLRENKTA